MRLIDADALTTWMIDELRKVPNGVFNALNGRQAANMIGMAIDDVPTIDAIPVEWLQRRRDIYLKAYHAGHESEIHTAAILNDTLMAWQKEQKEQEAR